MARFEFDLPADAPPHVVRRALLDFSERRPDLWPGLPRNQYEVYEIGETWAVVREGYRGPIWWRERYEWSESGPIRCTALESGFGAPGSSFTIDISSADGGGSRVHVVWDRRGRTLFGRLFVGLLWLTRGLPVRRSFEMGLARIADRGPSAASSNVRYAGSTAVGWARPRQRRRRTDDEPRRSRRARPDPGLGRSGGPPRPG